MKKNIRFIKDNGFWYADLPAYIDAGGNMEDCLMVAGADTWLDFLAGKDAKEITLTIGTTPLQEKLVRYHKDDGGATYIAHTYKEEDINHQLWLCPVTLFVFGEYPNTIYYEVV